MAYSICSILLLCFVKLINIPNSLSYNLTFLLKCSELVLKQREIELI